MSYCRRAIAYIKEFLPENADDKVIKLSESDGLVCKDIGNGILVTYLVDEGNHFSYIQNKHLIEEGLTENELHIIGVNNLKEIALGTVKLQEHGNIYPLFLNGNYESSLILINELWDDLLAQYATNGFIIAIPARDIIAFCDINSNEGITELKQLNERVYENADHQLTNCLYKRQNSQWVRVLNA